MACDIRIAEEQAQMALPEAKVGLLPCAGGTQRLSWLVGEGWAKRIILCGERINAAPRRDRVVRWWGVLRGGLGTVESPRIVSQRLHVIWGLGVSATCLWNCFPRRTSAKA